MIVTVKLQTKTEYNRFLTQLKCKLTYLSFYLFVWNTGVLSGLVEKRDSGMSNWGLRLLECNHREKNLIQSIEFLPSFKLGHDIGGTSIVSKRVSFIFFMAGVKKTRENNVFQVNRQNFKFWLEGNLQSRTKKYWCYLSLLRVQRWVNWSSSILKMNNFYRQLQVLNEKSFWFVTDSTLLCVWLHASDCDTMHWLSTPCDCPFVSHLISLLAPT